MSGEIPKPKANAGAAAGSPSSKRVSPVTGNSTGRVKFDDRGNAVWEWALGPGASDTEAPSERLKKLGNPDLSLAEDTPASLGAVKQNPLGAVKGYSPYDSGVLGKAEAPRKKDLKKLSEWLKLKKQAGSNKLDED